MGRDPRTRARTRYITVIDRSEPVIDLINRATKRYTEKRGGSPPRAPSDRTGRGGSVLLRRPPTKEGQHSTGVDSVASIESVASMLDVTAHLRRGSSIP